MLSQLCIADRTKLIPAVMLIIINFGFSPWRFWLLCSVTVEISSHRAAAAHARALVGETIRWTDNQRGGLRYRSGPKAEKWRDNLLGEASDFSLHLRKAWLGQQAVDGLGAILLKNSALGSSWDMLAQLNSGSDGWRTATFRRFSEGNVSMASSCLIAWPSSSSPSQLKAFDPFQAGSAHLASLPAFRDCEALCLV